MLVVFPVCYSLMKSKNRDVSRYFWTKGRSCDEMQISRLGRPQEVPKKQTENS